MKKKDILRVLGLLALVGIFGLVHEFLVGRLKVITNRGVSFGWFLGGEVLVAVVWMVVVFWWWKKRSWGWLFLVVGGGLNLLDRWRFGVVRDYWSFPGGIYNNVNDYLIGLAVFVFILEWWRKR